MSYVYGVSLFSRLFFGFLFLFCGFVCPSHAERNASERPVFPKKKKWIKVLCLLNNTLKDKKGKKTKNKSKKWTRLTLRRGWARRTCRCRWNERWGRNIAAWRVIPTQSAAGIFVLKWRGSVVIKMRVVLKWGRYNEKKRKREIGLPLHSGRLGGSDQWAQNTETLG